MKSFFLSVLVFCVAFFAKGQDSTALQFSKEITQTTLETHLKTLASDAYEGRGTGTLGQKKAAYYIKSRFEEIGLLPVLPEDSAKYYQYFRIINNAKYDFYEHEIRPKGRNKIADSKFYCTPNFKLIAESIEIIWLGDGFDYQNIPIKGKIAMVWLGSNSSETAQLDDIQKRISIAKEKGAKGIFFVHPTESDFKQFKARSTMMANLKKKAQDPSINISDFGIVYFHPKAAAKLLNLSFKNFEKIIKEDFKNLKTNQININFGRAFKTDLTENVIGILPGTTRSNEYVFVIAHYDHLGINEDLIYNGADDNGSGTTTLLNIAKTYANAAKAGFSPERNIVFIAFSGEELGLLGSNYFTSNLLIPHNSIHTVFNVDMIGRGEFGKRDGKLNLFIVGEKSENERNETIANANFPMIHLDYEYNSKNHPEQLYYRSDHYNFAKYGIPFIFFTTGLHNDYHKPTDDSDKINYETLELIAQLMFLNVWQAANE